MRTEAEISDKLQDIWSMSGRGKANYPRHAEAPAKRPNFREI